MVCSSSLAKLNPDSPAGAGDDGGVLSSGDTSEGTASTASGGDDLIGDKRELAGDAEGGTGRWLAGEGAGGGGDGAGGERAH